MYKPFTKLCCFVLSAILLLNMLPLQSFAAQIDSITDSTTAALPEDSAELSASVVKAMELTANRTEYSKDFRLSNGLTMSAVYAEPVHYKTGNTWKEIDNTLVLHSDGSYRNMAGVWDVKLPGQLSNSQDISITKDGYTLSFRMSGALENNPLSRSGDAMLHTALGTAKGSLQRVDLSAQQEAAPVPEAVPEKNYARMRYSNVLSGTSVQYDLQSNTVKESVILDSYNASLRGYRYTLNTGGMIPVLEEDGSITLYDEKQETVVMVMPAPFLVDAGGVRCDDIQVIISGNGSLYTLSYLLPTTWLAAQDRAWPVVLDPIVKAEMDENNILDCTVSPTMRNSADNALKCGYDADNGGIHRALLQYQTLPALPQSSATIVKAELQLGLISGDSDDYVVQVHGMKNPWSIDTANWATAQDYAPLITDYAIADCIMTPTNNKRYTLNVTEIVRDWYATENKGLLLRASDAMETSGSENYLRFGASEFSVQSGGPTLFVYTRHMVGLENYYSYQTMSAGNAGAAYVADATGQLKVVVPVASYTSGINPFSMNLVYNSDYFAKDSTEPDTIASTHGIGMHFGAGFTLDAIHSVEKATILKENEVYEYLVWHEGDGTDHYFHKDGDHYRDEDGRGLTLTDNGGNDYTMSDQQGTQWLFDDGLFYKYKDASENTIVIQWQGSGENRYFTRIYQQNSGIQTGNTPSALSVFKAVVAQQVFCHLTGGGCLEGAVVLPQIGTGVAATGKHLTGNTQNSACFVPGAGIYSSAPIIKAELGAQIVTVA